MTEQQLLSNWRGNHQGLPCFYGQAEEVPAMFSGDRSQDAVSSGDQGQERPFKEGQQVMGLVRILSQSPGTQKNTSFIFFQNLLRGTHCCQENLAVSMEL